MAVTKKFNSGDRGNVYKFNLTENPTGVRAKEGFNVRKDYGDLEELKNSLVSKGMKVPAQGRTQKDPETGEKFWQLSDGHRRLAAAQLAVAEGEKIIFLIQAEPQKNYTDLDRLVDMSTRNSGKPLNPIEEAELYRRLVEEHNLTPKEVAGMVSKSYVHVNSMLNLLSGVTEETKDLISTGKVSATVVVGMQKSKLAPEVIEENIKDALEETGKKKVTAKDITGAVSGRERKPVPAISVEDTEEHGEAVKEPKNVRKEPLDPADRDPVKGVPANAVSPLPLDFRVIKNAILAEVAEGANYNAHAKHYISLFEKYAKGQISLSELVGSFVYFDEPVEAV